MFIYLETDSLLRICHQNSMNVVRLLTCIITVQPNQINICTLFYLSCYFTALLKSNKNFMCKDHVALSFV